MTGDDSEQVLGWRSGSSDKSSRRPGAPGAGWPVPPPLEHGCWCALGRSEQKDGAVNFRR